jgi:cytochrome c oxidase subunit 4
MSEHIVPVKVYLAIFFALMILTALTTWVAFIDMGPSNIVIALLIAGTKASLVVLFFMHVRYSKRIIWLTVFSGLLWMVILMGLTLADIFTRDWIPPAEGWL